MEYVYIGRISTTHGLKGELKIRSNFKYKEKAFVVGNYFYLGKGKEKFKVVSYRKHQDYDMVIFDSLDDIDKVIKYKGCLVYIARNDLLLNDKEYTDEDYIGSKCVFNNEDIGEIIDIVDAGNGNYLFLMKKDKDIYIPKNDNFIKEFDFNSKIVYFKDVEGLL